MLLLFITKKGQLKEKYEFMRESLKRSKNEFKMEKEKKITKRNSV